jgi:hypothetical protein
MTRPASSGADYVRFLARGFVFLLPIAAFCMLPVWALDRLGELRSIDTAEVARAQVVRHEDVLYGPAYTDCAQQLKMVGTLESKAEVLLLGTSRSLQVRREFFKAPFYNAGAVVAVVGHLREFLAKVPASAQPKVIVLLLDQFFLNEETDKHVRADYRPLDEALGSCVPPLTFLEESWPRFYRDLLARKISPSLLSDPHRERVGVRAKALVSGYRPDGSFRIPGPEPFDEVRDRMAKGRHRYEPLAHPSASMIEELDRFLAECRRRGIDVVGILPPYAPTIWDEMHAIGKWPYVDEVAGVLAPRFAAHGHAVYDYSDTRGIGLTDREFYDGFHGSERAFGAIFADAAKKDPTLARVVDVEGLERMLAASSDPFSIVPEK